MRYLSIFYASNKLSVQVIGTRPLPLSIYTSPPLKKGKADQIVAKKLFQLQQ